MALKTRLPGPSGEFLLASETARRSNSGCELINGVFPMGGRVITPVPSKQKKEANFTEELTYLGNTQRQGKRTASWPNLQGFGRILEGSPQPEPFSPDVEPAPGGTEHCPWNRLVQPVCHMDLRRASLGSPPPWSIGQNRRKDRTAQSWRWRSGVRAV